MRGRKLHRASVVLATVPLAWLVLGADIRCTESEARPSLAGLEAEIDALQVQVQAMEERLDEVSGYFTPPAIYFAAELTVMEGSTETLPVLLSKPSAFSVEVSYQSFDGSAIAPDDYDGPIEGTLVFAPGETEHSITISAPDNGEIGNPDVDFTIVFSDPVRGTLAETSSTITVVDDGDMPSVYFFPQSSTSEGLPFRFYARVQQYRGMSCTDVRYYGSYSAYPDHGGISILLEPKQTGPGWVTWGEDLAFDGQIEIPTGTWDHAFMVETVVDDEVEGDEWFDVSLVEISGADFVNCTSNIRLRDP
jgi:hypothetical protein